MSLKLIFLQQWIKIALKKVVSEKKTLLTKVCALGQGVLV
jgi:hypothetical protein